MIRINAFVELITVKDRARVLELAKEMIKYSLNEEGCIAYDIFESSFRPEVLLFCETWKDEEVAVAHSKSEHFARLIPEIQKLAKMKLEKFTF